LSALKDAKASIVVETSEPKIIQAKNVIGYIDGTDPALKDEVILVGAHYDHVGIGRPVDNENNEPDSIYNGARDNAAGTVALMMAAKELSQNPPKRPVALIAITAEESGLVGSRYYASNPAIALKRTAFFLNNDNGGYNDTTITTVVGASRSNVKSAIKEGIAKKDLEFYDSEELDQGFFERSDNISLSVKGVPSATISMGFRQMDNEITQYYHQPADEVETMDMGYITKWIEGFVEATRNIANMEEKPFWKKGDSFEELGKKLYDLE
jgi:Zn-dependent M28 family amino/carboxypeptidase